MKSPIGWRWLPPISEASFDDKASLRDVIASIQDAITQLASDNYISRITFDGISTEVHDQVNIKRVEVEGTGLYRIHFLRAYANIGYSFNISTRKSRQDDGLGATIVHRSRHYIDIQALSWPPNRFEPHELISVIIIGKISDEP